jgi:hypothetical protein
MATEKVFLKGFRFFKPNDKAPAFVKASVVLSPNELISCIKENEKYFTEYNGNKQLKLQLLENDKGLYFVVDTYKMEKDSFIF